MKEMEKQCEMAWERGNTLGRVQGVGIAYLGIIFYEIIKAIF